MQAQCKPDFATTIDSAAIVGFEVLTVVVIKYPVFRYIVPFSRLKVCRRFGEICRLLLLRGRISQARKEYETGSTEFMLISCLVYFSILKMEVSLVFSISSTVLCAII